MISSFGYVSQITGGEAQDLHWRNKKDMKKAFWLIMTGVAIGILIAPDKGSETWKKITGSLDDLKEKARKSMDDLIDTGKDIAKKGIKGAEEVSNEW
jgi:gas vesicle protein